MKEENVNTFLTFECGTKMDRENLKNVHRKRYDEMNKIFVIRVIPLGFVTSIEEIFD